jgi:hypothetical protein
MIPPLCVKLYLAFDVGVCETIPHWPFVLFPHAYTFPSLDKHKLNSVPHFML